MLHNTTTPWLLPLIRGTRGLLGPPPTSPPPPPTPHPLQWAALAWQRGQHPYVQAVNEMVNAALSRDWDAAEDLLRQFPFLRALVVVVAWDRVPGVVVGIAQAGREGGGGGVYRLRREIVSRLAHHQSHDQSHHQSISRLAGGWVHPDNSKSGTARYTPMSVTWELLPHMVATLEHRIAIADAVYGNTDSDAAAYAVLCQLETQSALKVTVRRGDGVVCWKGGGGHVLYVDTNWHTHVALPLCFLLCKPCDIVCGPCDIVYIPCAYSITLHNNHTPPHLKTPHRLSPSYNSVACSPPQLLTTFSPPPPPPTYTNTPPLMMPTCGLYVRH